VLSTTLRRYVTGILPRYVLGQVTLSFAMALVTMTAIFVLIMVMNVATRNGLSPLDVLRLIPLVIPATLPYTVPVALLFAVSVVYGRLASDNEVIAVKTAGCDVGTVLGPSLAFGLVLSGALLAACFDAIPRATRHVQEVLFENIEDVFYKVLKKDHEVDNPNWPFFISVKDVEGNVLIGAKFKHRARGAEDPNAFDLWIDAQRASIRFDPAAGVAHVKLVGSEIRETGNSLILIHDDHFDMPINGRPREEPRVQELTAAGLIERQRNRLALLRNEPSRQAIAAALWIASGRMERVDWQHVHGVWKDRHNWEQGFHAAETEWHMRVALSFGSLFFVLLGAPVGILSSRRDFLSSFMTCMVPIMVVYYPLILLGTNLGKDGVISAYFVYLGNVVLAVCAGFAFHPVWRH
jgi:lipopolysaccharide export system permease protein